MGTPPDHPRYPGEARFPGPNASATTWDRHRVQGFGVGAPPAQKQALRRSSHRADTKDLHRTKSAPPRDRDRNCATPRSKASTASTCSTSNSSLRRSGSSKHVQGGTKGSGKPYGLGGVHHKACDTREDLTRTPLVAIPGYSGFTPGVHAGNVHGETFARTNKAGLEDVRAYRTGKVPKKFEPPSRWAGEYGTYSPGAEIPGYSGHTPGLHAGNMIGMCTPRCAKAEWRPPNDFGRGKFVEPLIVGHVSNGVHG